jgi:putative Holliday junction resolvase
MARILAIDYGLKRCGIAVTDPLQIIVSGLDTVETPSLLSFLGNYIGRESVEKIVIGLPVHKDGNFTSIKGDIDKFVTVCRTKWPDIPVVFADEQFSSVLAKKIILDSGAKKKKRQDKALVDKVSAVVILQKYLGHI